MVDSYKAKSVVISRKPGKDKDGFKTAFIGLFKENNPHLKGKIPFEVIEVKDTEKVRIRELRNISYYLMIYKLLYIFGFYHNQHLEHFPLFVYHSDDFQHLQLGI